MFLSEWVSVLNVEFVAIIIMQLVD